MVSLAIKNDKNDAVKVKEQMDEIGRRFIEGGFLFPSKLRFVYASFVCAPDQKLIH